jgi:hypothetical protein
MSFSPSDPPSALEEAPSTSALNRSAFTSSGSQNSKRSFQTAFDGKSIPSLFFTSQSLLLFHVLSVILIMSLFWIAVFEKDGSTLHHFCSHRICLSRIVVSCPNTLMTMDIINLVDFFEEDYDSEKYLGQPVAAYRPLLVYAKGSIYYKMTSRQHKDLHIEDQLPVVLM